MYRHSITVYNADGDLLAKIPDAVNLSNFGFKEYADKSYLGGPVEAVFSEKGKYLWVSNYNMIGTEFNNPGCDACNGKGYDPGFIYKINTTNYKIENAIKVGAVPKFLALSKDEKLLIASNWSSGDISIVDLITEKEIKKVDVGAHPRGLSISSDSKKAYVTIMGSTKIARVDLMNYEVDYLTNIGKSPRHIVLTKNDSLLYISLNSSNSIVKYNLVNNTKEECKTNGGPRTMILSPDENYIYVVNYFANTFSKIRTDSMKVVEVVPTGNHPIGITANWQTAEVWVACYEGKLEVFKDFHLESLQQKENYLFEEELALFISFFQPNFIDNRHQTVNDTNKNSPELVDRRDDEDSAGFVEESNNVPKDLPEKKSSLAVAKTNSTISSTVKNDRLNKEVLKSNDELCAYHVIVGSFSIPENAKNFQQTLIDKGYVAQLIPTSKGLTYVSARCFSSIENANNAIPTINKDVQVSAWVLHR